MTQAATVGTDSHTGKPAARRRLDPCGIVIFGASGDLTARKLIPALYRLFQLGRLPQGFYIVGVARRKLGADVIRNGTLSVAVMLTDKTAFVAQPESYKSIISD